MHHVFSSQPWIPSPEHPRVRALYESLGSEQRIRRGGSLKREGEPNRLFFLRQGLCAYVINEDSARSQIVGLILPGCSMGDITCITGQRVNVHTRALRDAEVLTLRPQILQDAIRADGEMALIIARDTVFKLESMMEGMAINLSEAPASRLRLLLHALLAVHGGVQPGFNPLPLGLSTEELAALIHATRVTVSRVLSRWQELDLLHKRGRQIAVHARLFEQRTGPPAAARTRSGRVTPAIAPAR